MLLVQARQKKQTADARRVEGKRSQARENIGVISDRIRERLGAHTDVLDARTRRVRSLASFVNATDESLTVFHLRRAVGDR
jgi:hypothetical protein